MSAFRRGLLGGLHQLRASCKRHFSTDNKQNNGTPWDAYTSALERSPLLTKSITSAVLSLVADVICQKIFPNKGNKEDEDSDKVAQLDLQRAGKFTFLGLVLVGPVLHKWYGFLNTFSKNSLVKLALDQMLFAPAFVATFLSSALLLDGKSDEIRPKLEREWVSTVIANCSLWVPAQFINFNFVPAKFQVLFSNCVGVVWNIYLSYKCYDVGPPTEEKRDQKTEGGK